MNAITHPRRSDRHYRSVFISDTHLGTRGCRVDFLADFLSRVSCERLYLVGDIIDGWRLRKSWYWDGLHDEVLRLILRHARAGTEVVYIPGNHDEMFRTWMPLGLEIAGIRLLPDAVHETADGRRLLVIHGDQFDSVVRYAKFLALLGDWAYTAALVDVGKLSRKAHHQVFDAYEVGLRLKPAQGLGMHVGVERLPVAGNQRVAQLVDQTHGEERTAMNNFGRFCFLAPYLIHPMSELAAGYGIGEHYISGVIKQ